MASELRRHLYHLATQDPSFRRKLLASLRDLRANLAFGDTVYLANGMVRVHLYRTNLQVTDMTNAGKRGKMVSFFRIHFANASMIDNLQEVIAPLLRASSYQEAVDTAKGIGSQHFPILTFEAAQEKGINVVPSNQKITLRTPWWELESTPRSFIFSQIKTEDPRLPSEVGGAQTTSHAKAIFQWLSKPGILEMVERLDWKELISAISKATGDAPRHR